MFYALLTHLIKMLEPTVSTILFRNLMGAISILLSCSVFAASPAIKIGEPLPEVLERYSALGLNVVSTSRTLPRRLRVKVLPNPDDTLISQVDHMLAPHRLHLVILDPYNAYVSQLPKEAKDTNRRIETISRDTADNIIEELIVTSHYRVARRQTQMQGLDQQALQTLPSLGRDVLRGLTALPGVASSGISARHRFRGGDSNEVLYRLDGIELLEPFHLSSVSDLFTAVNANIIDSADIYVAGFPVSLGSRMSGVVDLALVEPEDDFGGNIDINPITIAANAQGWLGDTQWLASSRRSVLHKSLDLFETDYGTPRFQDDFVHISHQGSAYTFNAAFLSSRDRVRIQDSTEQGSAQNNYEAAWVRWTQAHTDSLESEWRISHISIDSSRNGTVNNPVNSIGRLSENRKFKNLELATNWRWQINNIWGLESGLSAATQEGDFGAQLEATYGATSLPIQAADTLARDLNVSRSGESYQSYFSAIAQVHPRLKVEAGIRYDGQDIDPVHVNELSARVNAEFQALTTLKLGLNIGRYTQQQHLYEIQIDNGLAELEEPQHSDQINLTSIWSPSSAWRLRLDVYHREIQGAWSHFDNLYNRWVLFPELAGDRIEISPSEVKAAGAEFSLHYQPTSSFSVGFQYTYSETEEKYLGRTRPRPWDQKQVFKLSSTWLSERWHLGLNAVHRTGWPTTAFITVPTQTTNNAFTDRLPSFTSIDVHISRIFKRPRTQIELYLDVINLTDEDNVGGYDYSADGIADPQSLLPLFPTIGVSLSW